MKQTIVLIVILIGLLSAAVWLTMTPMGIPKKPQDAEKAQTPTKPQAEVPQQAYGPGGDAHLIAVIGERTGPAGPQNESVYHAVRYAIDNINDAGGIAGKPLTLIEFDNRTEPILAKRAAEIAASMKVKAVIGSSRSSNSAAMAPVLQRAGIVMISPESTNPKVTTYGDHIFRACFTDPFQGEILSAFAIEKLNKKTAMTLTCAGRLFSTGLTEIFRKEFAERGGTILGDLTYLETDADFTSQVEAMLEKQPEVVFIPGEVRDAGLIIRQATEAGLKTTWIGPDSWNLELLRTGGPGTEGSYFSSHWHRESDNPRSQQFVAEYEEKVAPLQRAGVAMFYDATRLLADALERSGGEGGTALRDSLNATAYEGITGNYAFDNLGDPIGKSAVIIQLKDGAAQFISLQEP